MRWGDSVEMDDEGDFRNGFCPHLRRVIAILPARAPCSSTVAAKKMWPLSPSAAIAAG